jgi:hypothetical protein
MARACTVIGPKARSIGGIGLEHARDRLLRRYQLHRGLAREQPQGRGGIEVIGVMVGR